MAAQAASARPGSSPEAEGRVPSQHERRIDELVFKRDLNETYLLMDFVSGRTDRSLDQLTMIDPMDSKTRLSSIEIVKRVAALRYPPDPDPSVKSENAALLLVAKDHLSGLARPARALTIAYTIMFAEGGGHRIRDWFGKRRNETAAPPDPRSDLAKDVFPALQRHAELFRMIRTSLVFITILWLLLTVFTYWQVALTRSVLQRLDFFWKDRVELTQANVELLSPDKCPGFEAGKSFNENHVKIDEKNLSGCRRLYYIDRSRHEARLDLDRVVDCSGAWPNVVSRVLAWREVQCRPPGGNVSAGEYKVSWQSANSVISAFSTYVLPMMFGLLGTLIAALRSLQNKVRDSLLEPRDLVLMLLGLPLGLVAGVAVGLFFSPSGAAVPGSATPAGELSLTASGLGFVAGYGAEAFFRFMDGVLARAFPERLPVPERAQTNPQAAVGAPAAPAPS